MFNVTVLKMKDILKYLSSFALAVMIIILIGKSLGKAKENGNSENGIIQKLESKIDILSKNNMMQALDLTIPVISNINKEYREIAKEDKEKDEEQNQSKNVLKGMLGVQISAINGMENIEKEKSSTISEEEDNNENLENQTEKIEEAGVETEVITQNPIKDGSNTNIRSVKIKNETSYQLTEDLFNTNDLVLIIFPSFIKLFSGANTSIFSELTSYKLELADDLAIGLIARTVAARGTANL